MMPVEILAFVSDVKVERNAGLMLMLDLLLKS
jgi:hypothetical protein